MALDWRALVAAASYATASWVMATQSG
jgi:hypothetical protein